MNLTGGWTRREYDNYRAMVIAMSDVVENQKKFRQPITDADIDYLKMAMEAPDVNLFVSVM